MEVSSLPAGNPFVADTDNHYGHGPSQVTVVDGGTGPDYSRTSERVRGEVARSERALAERQFDLAVALEKGLAEAKYSGLREQKNAELRQERLATDLSKQMSGEINSVRTEIQAVKDMLKESTIQGLRDQLADAKAKIKI